NHRVGRAWETVAPGALRRGAAGLARALPAPARRYADMTFLDRPATPRALFFEGFSVFPTAIQDGLLADRALLAGDPHEIGRAHFEAAPGGLGARLRPADVQTCLVDPLMPP